MRVRLRRTLPSKKPGETPIVDKDERRLRARKCQTARLPLLFSFPSPHSFPLFFPPQECIISGLLSVMGLKVLHIDRNAYYGGDCASLNLTNLYAKFRPEGSREPSPALGSNRDYNVDLVPKFIMACGNLVKILLHTKVREGGRGGGGGAWKGDRKEE